MVSRQSSYSMTSCPPADHCSICGLHFWWRDVKAISPKPTSKHNDSPQNRYISCNAKEFNVQIERRCSAKLFDTTLHHLCIRYTIRHYAEPFHATLYCLNVHCTIRHYVKLFEATLHLLCVRCAARHYPEPFEATLHHLCTVMQMSTKLFVNWASLYDNVMFQLDMGDT